ncbi:MAG: hypothetical protein CMI17_07905 [Opitutaceae bacterium]|nr:hypothetical protein [Opitutaceae bacterium]
MGIVALALARRRLG